MVRLPLLAGRTDEDDGTAALAQSWQRPAHEADRAHCHELERQEPLRVGQGVERSVGHVAGVDDENIETPEPGERVFREALDIGGDGEVGLK